jgi:hypothetical protein
MAVEDALKPFSRRVDPAALGYGLVAFMSLTMSQAEPESVHEGLLALPEVVEVHYTTGDADLLAHVVAKDTTDLHRITKAILAIDGVDRTSTAISLAEGHPLPAPVPPAPPGQRMKRVGPDDARACSFQATVTPPEEVRPMNAVSTWVLPLPVTAGD